MSATDKTRALMFYPPIDDVKTETLNLSDPISITLADEEQGRFNIRLPSDAVVDIYTTGEADTYMVLVRGSGGSELTQLVTDDDSGENRNASIRYKLDAGIGYTLQLRLYWQPRKSKNGEPAVLPKLHMESRKEESGSKCCMIL
ncbi:hypothetical protein ACA910_020643 [Epithemia clementina (nom. ined.)]